MSAPSGGVAGSDIVLRILLVVGGVAFLALGVLSAVAAIEGANGPTGSLTAIGFVWEFVFVVATVPMLVAMAIINRATRSVAAWVLWALAAVCLIAAAVVAVLRMAGLVDVLLPLVNWVPGTVFVVAWGWIASRSAVGAGLLGRGFGRSAAVLAVAEIAVLVLAALAVGVAGTRAPAVNVAAGVVAAAITVAVGVWWVALAARWRRVGRTVGGLNP